MNVLIIEDEPQAAQRLSVLLQQQGLSIQIAGICDSVVESVSWLKSYPAPDLIMMDIHLADGISFEIFDHVEISAPVIFTTAYDSYALKAFKVNSIDYLLKPIDTHELAQALAKWQTRVEWSAHRLLEQIGYARDIVRRSYKERFLIRAGDRLRSVAVADVLFFVSREHVSLAHTRDHRELVLDVTLDQVEALVDPHDFFRINRKFIVHISAFQDVVVYTNSRLRVRVQGCAAEDMIVARERVAGLKQWLDR